MDKGKVALITGSTSGIGLGIAQYLALKGFKIILHGLEDKEYIKNILENLSSMTEVLYLKKDLTKPSDCRELVDEGSDHFRRLDVLVNNAGMQFVNPVESYPLEMWDKVIRLNLSATFHCLQRALPIMRSQNFGRIINIVSTHGLVGSIHKSAYVASKHGVIGLTKVVGLETAKENITCNAVCPGWVYTPLVEKQVIARAEKEGIDIEAAKLKLLAEKQPSEQFVKPEDVGAFVEFLCSESASQMCGGVYTMDGGWTAQ